MTFVPPNAEWYVKTGLDRALRLTKQQIEHITKRIASLKTQHAALSTVSPTHNDLEFLTEFIKEGEGIKSYYEQWLSEATEAYKTLPKEIQPFLSED